MYVKIAESSGIVLDWFVAIRLGVPSVSRPKTFVYKWNKGKHRYSSDWAFGGPVIEAFDICVDKMNLNTDIWRSWNDDEYRRMGFYTIATGPTPLIAAMRCLVVSSFGDELIIPRLVFDNGDKDLTN